MGWIGLTWAAGGQVSCSWRHACSETEIQDVIAMDVSW